ncbi:MAG: hypothetical protein LBD88_05405 [Candidatus Peribacteria bacterium]|jgi:hypothetical protein|nr:hypothetical protein [Candidatus Peribacteria bacterium]
MIKKILWFLVIVFVLYILLIFTYPNLADKIENKLGIKSFNEFIRNFKTTLDDICTNLPTKDEVKNAYNKTLS